MLYVKDGKTYFAPIVIEQSGIRIYTNDKDKILAAGYAEYVAPERSVESLIADSDRNINRETDNKILNDFTWRDNKFYLTMENQTNFANMFVAKEFLSYPVTVKTQDGFIELADQSEVTEFYLAGINFVKQCLEEGWTRKAEAAEAIRNGGAA